MSDEILDERQRLIQAGLDGELNAKDIALRAKLLAGDADARDEATSLAALRELIAEDRASIRAPIGLAGRMNEELARRMAPAPVTRARWSPLRSLAAAASILVLVGASFVLGRQTTSAAVDTVLSDLRESEIRITKEHPELDGQAIETIFTQARARIATIENEAKFSRRDVLVDLEEKVAALIRSEKGR